MQTLSIAFKSWLKGGGQTDPKKILKKKIIKMKREFSKWGNSNPLRRSAVSAYNVCFVNSISLLLISLFSLQFLTCSEKSRKREGQLHCNSIFYKQICPSP